VKQSASDYRQLKYNKVGDLCVTALVVVRRFAALHELVTSTEPVNISYHVLTVKSNVAEADIVPKQLNFVT